MEIERVDVANKKIVLKVPEYYLSMDEPQLDNYCAIAKATQESLMNSAYDDVAYRGKRQK